MLVNALPRSYDAMNNPRILTILYYLNGNGATWFPLADGPKEVVAAFATHGEALEYAAKLDPERDGTLVRPMAPGDALVFYNFDEHGEPDPLTLHAGLEVAADEDKWIGTHFFDHPKLCAGYEDYVLDR
jgi:hypothetical protein